MERKMERLIYIATGADVKVGDTVKSFRGEPAVVTGWAPPTHGGSSGRIYVTQEGGWRGSFFPTVYGARFQSPDVD
jgi:hypothetical protein